MRLLYGDHHLPWLMFTAANLLIKLKQDAQDNKIPNHSQINKQKVMGMF
jgi:hypothetical protein